VVIAVVVVLAGAGVGIGLAVSSSGTSPSAGPSTTLFNPPTTVPNPNPNPNPNPVAPPTSSPVSPPASSTVPSSSLPPSASTTVPSPLAPTLSYVYGAVDTESSINGRTYELLATSQTHSRTSVARPSVRKVVGAQGCLSVLRGLYVDEQADIIVAEDVVVCQNSAQADAVSTALSADSTDLGIISLSVPLSAVRVYPDAQKAATAQLPAAPTTIGPAGPPTVGNPDASPGGVLYGATTVSNLVNFNATAYSDGRKATTADARLQRAAGDVRYLVYNSLAGITFTS
jgi:hypothetical protein